MTAATTKNWFNQVNFFFLVSALVLTALSIVSYQRFKKQSSSADLVSHTYLVKLKLEQCFGALIDVEGGQRGFLVSGDSIFFKQYLLSKTAITGYLHALDSLVADNPAQKHNLQKFKELVRLRINWIYSINNPHRINAGQFTAYFIQSKQISEQVKTHINEMEKEEDRLLSIRVNEKVNEEKKASAFILLFSLFSLAFLVFSFFRLKKETGLLSRSEYNAELLEQKVKERTAEISEMNKKLNQQNIELAQKNEELSSFTYIASHDLKEPLRKIETFTGRITETEHLSEKGKIFFERIIASIKRMQSLIDSVFTYAQAQSGIEFQLTDLTEIIKHSIDTLQESITEKQAVIEYSGLPRLHVIPEQMEQLFTNLLSNSLKYSKVDTNPHIKVFAEKINRPPNNTITWKITFADNGIGFDEIHKDKIFQIFQRLHPVHNYSGTGIGLAICKKITENHNGSIIASSKPGEGSIFTLILPENLQRQD
ncbi:MAG TPA: CHASE3 domain-containing protein [Chitinophagaceae bacterium]